MKFNASQRNRMLSGVGAIGLGLALIAIGYGLTPSAGLGVASPAVVVGPSMPAAASAPAEGLRERLWNVGLRDASSATPAADQALDDSRECDADKGVGEHCVYN